MSAFFTYRKVASSNASHLEVHAGFFRWLMKWIFNPYELCPLDKKLIPSLVLRVRTRDYTVYLLVNVNFDPSSLQIAVVFYGWPSSYVLKKRLDMSAFLVLFPGTKMT